MIQGCSLWWKHSSKKKRWSRTVTLTLLNVLAAISGCPLSHSLFSDWWGFLVFVEESGLGSLLLVSNPKFHKSWNTWAALLDFLALRPCGWQGAALTCTERVWVQIAPKELCEQERLIDFQSFAPLCCKSNGNVKVRSKKSLGFPKWTPGGLEFPRQIKKKDQNYYFLTGFEANVRYLLPDVSVSQNMC